MSHSVALYRKYRSRTFDEIVGQDHIVNNLRAALEKGQISHAYLFTGPRGTGKTSTARIMAREVNGLTVEDEQSYIDIVEIDAASHNSVDDIRELREGVITVPTQLAYKIYIIDEVHMLSGGAFNALLKTLEEPPAHAIFILATTEIHKLPATIISRTQRYNFRPPTTDIIASHIRHISDKENLKLTDNALRLIALKGEGSFRDAISVLDQVAAQADGEQINREQVEQILGLASQEQINDIVEAVFTQHNPHQLLATIDDMIGQGLSVSAITSQLRAELRRQLLEQLTPAKLSVCNELLRVDGATDQRLKLELVLLNAIGASDSSSSTSTTPADASTAKSKLKTAQPEPSPKSVSAKPASSKATTTKSKPVAATPNPALDKPEANNTPTSPASSEALETALEDWSSIITGLKQDEPSLYAVLRQASVSVGDEPNQLRIGFRYKLHLRKASHPEKQAMLKQLVEQEVDGNIELIMQHQTNVAPSTDEPSSKLDSVKNMLGGDIVSLGE